MMNPRSLPQLGWIGTGLMGRTMAKHLLDVGHSLHIFSRTREKANPLLEAGAIWCSSPQEVTARAQIVFTMVGFPDEVREVFCGESGLLSGVRAGQILVDMTTTKPSLAQEIAATCKKSGAKFLDAPVSGGDVGAKRAELSIMVGGDKEGFQEVLPLFERLGKNIVYHGPAGSGQHAKMANQITIASTMIGVCEALLYAEKAGLDLNRLLLSIAKGAAGCWTLEHLVPRMIRNDFAPGFLIDHFVKDMGIALGEARRMNLNLPGLTLAHDLYRETQNLGHGKKGTHALYLAVKKLSHSDIRPSV